MEIIGAFLQAALLFSKLLATCVDIMLRQGGWVQLYLTCSKTSESLLRRIESSERLRTCLQASLAVNLKLAFTLLLRTSRCLIQKNMILVYWSSFYIYLIVLGPFIQL